MHQELVARVEHLQRRNPHVEPAPGCPPQHGEHDGRDQGQPGICDADAHFAVSGVTLELRGGAFARRPA